MTGPARAAPCPVWGPALAELTRRGMLSGADVLGGEVIVEPASRSNEVGIVRSAGRPIAVLKRPATPLDGVDPFTAERAAYRALAGAGVSSPAPALLGDFDGVLAVEVVSGRPLHDLAGDVWTAAAPADSLSTALASLGRALASVHAVAPTTGLAPRRPWVLALATSGLPELLAADPELGALAATIAADADLRAALAEVAERWRDTALMHGDVKFDNVIVVRRHHAVLVDWELAGRGWPAWDVAGVVDGLVVPGVTALGRDPLDAAAGAGVALAAYAAAAGSPGLDRDDVALATVARLVQSAVQLTAMRHLRADGAELGARVLDAARRLAAVTTDWTNAA